MKSYFKNNKTTASGYLLVLLSSFIFYFGEYFIHNSNDLSVLFICNYVLAIIFLVITFTDKKEGKKGFTKNFKLQNTSIALVLFNISAYSLNRDIVVFRESTTWLVAFLIVFNFTFLLYGIKDKLPKWFHGIIVCVLSIGIIFQIYEAITIAHLSIFGLLVFWVLGLSLHALVPLCFVILTGLQLRYYSHNAKRTKWLITGSISLTAIFVSGFSIWYNSIHHSISRAEDLTNSYNQKQGLPKWVAVSQKLTNNYITEKVLKADLIYQTFEKGFWDLDLNSLQDQRVHDPLVSIADVFVNHDDDLNTSDKLKIIKSLYGFRHLNEERLWNNRNLRTKSIISNVELFPKERLTYTEYFVTVRNNSSNERSQNEAIYTFELPEGSAVSSLSLWINGNEEKGILTTKGLAKKAYKTVVGVERRDPSLIQWREGNKISVRVFPCTPLEDRQFKIGITSPLKFKNDKLIYESIKIEGEHVLDTKQYLKIVNEDILVESENINLDRENEFDYEGVFNQEFCLTINTPPTPEGEFVWKDKRYKIVSPTMISKSFNANNIYLDLNANWTLNNVIELMSALPNGKFWVMGKEKVEITERNRELLVKRYQKNRFSLFPFHKLTESSALVITHDYLSTPNLNELYDSDFGKSIKTIITETHSDITLINLGDKKTDYIQSLTELSVFDYKSTSLSETKEILKTGSIEIPKENNDLIHIPQSNISIEKTDGESTSATPNNHIYRLFAYKDILNRIGTSYFDEDYLNQELIDLASDANIVTPLSSLIVLETQNDYDRFGIKKDEDSLGNASIGNSGAVPEPHEWALIIMLLSFVLFLGYKKYKNKLNHAK